LRFDGSGLWTEFAFAAEYLQSIQAKTPMKTLPKTPESILDLLRDEPALTVAALAKTLGKSRSAILRAIKKLREEGRLRYVGPQKGGHWEIMET
jgi:predicted HTH transcriptional regulator